MIIHQIDFGTPAYDEAIRLREEVLWKPLNLSFTTQNIEREVEDVHIGLYNDYSVLVGCLSIGLQHEEIATIYQVVVKNILHKSGVGKTLLSYAIDWASSHQYHAIQLDAHSEVIGFYEKLGFHKFGKPFYAANIKHYQMKMEF